MRQAGTAASGRDFSLSLEKGARGTAQVPMRRGRPNVRGRDGRKR